MKKIIILFLLCVSISQAQISLSGTPPTWRSQNGVLTPIRNEVVGLSGGGQFRYFGGAIQYTNDGTNWLNFVTGTGGWTLGASKVFPTIAGNKVHIRTSAGDTTGTALLNVYGTSYFNGNATFAGTITTANSAGSSVTISTNGANGSYATPLNMDINFDGYGLTTKARIRASDYSANSTHSNLVFSAYSHSVLTTLLTLDGSTSNATFAGSVSATNLTLTGIVTITSVSYSVTAIDAFIKANATSNAITINLPAVSTSTGREITIKKIDSSANIVTLDANGSETIDGSTTKTITLQYESATIVCDGTSWLIK